MGRFTTTLDKSAQNKMGISFKMPSAVFNPIQRLFKILKKTKEKKNPQTTPQTKPLQPLTKPNSPSHMDCLSSPGSKKLRIYFFQNQGVLWRSYLAHGTSIGSESSLPLFKQAPTLVLVTNPTGTSTRQLRALCMSLSNLCPSVLTIVYPLCEQHHPPTYHIPQPHMIIIEGK